MKILLVDNYDSFTFNLIHILKELSGEGDTIDIVKNDQINFNTLETYHKIILSPGPGIPSEAGGLLKLLKEFSPSLSILGVCLGHQAIGEAFGAEVIPSPVIYHGVQSEITVIADNNLFNGLPKQLRVGRYHSWIINNDHLPECLQVTATDEDEQIMAIAHKTYDIHGVQFHPESIMTPSGKQIIQNFIYN